MKITFDLKLEKLRAMRRFASTDGERLTLNGVHIEVGPARQVVMAATDGRRLGSYAYNGTIAFTPEAQFTIPNELIDAIPINMKTLRLPMQFDYDDQGGGNITVRPSRADITISCAPVAGSYPKWRVVVPDPWPESFDAGFLSANMKYLADFFDAASELIGHDQLAMAGGMQHQAIGVRGAGKNGEGEFFGLLMPVLQADGGKALGELPLWIKP